jgi:uncharacterized protein (TIGR00730 family)
MVLRSVCVFCGSSPGKDPLHVAAARELGGELARRGIQLVTGGGGTGMMGAVADATLEGGGQVQGVIPHLLVEREVAHTRLTYLHKVDTMHERKALMAELSDAFIALPGGLGTLEELFEVLTWAQLGIHSKPIGILDVAGYFAPLHALIDHAVEGGFVPPATKPMVCFASEPDELLERLQSAPAPR